MLVEVPRVIVHKRQNRFTLSPPSYPSGWRQIDVGVKHMAGALKPPLSGLKNLPMRKIPRTNTQTTQITVNNGYLGSRNDEERSEMRYVMRIAEFSESSNFRTQIALSGYTWKYTSLTIGLKYFFTLFVR